MKERGFTWFVRFVPENVLALTSSPAISQEHRPSERSRLFEFAWFRRRAAQALYALRVCQQFHQSERQIRGAHDAHSISAVEERDDVAEVLGVVPYHDRRALLRRLNDIVPAARH